MKTFKSFISLLVALVLCISCFITVNAATCTTNLQISSTSPKVGDTITVTVTFICDEKIMGTSAKVAYNKSVLTFLESSDAFEVSNTINIAKGGTPSTTKSYPLSFKVTGEGSCLISVSDCIYNLESVSGDNSATGCSYVLNVKAPTPSTPSTTTPTVSSNANLKSLSVSGVTLSPAFSAGQTGYTATVANDVEKVTVSAAAADSGAKVSGAGSYPLDIGNNKISITVTAADGTKKYYSLSIKRQTAEETAAESAPTDQGGENPLSVTVDGKDYTVATDISTYKVPAGFTATRGIYGETEVAALTLSDLALYYLVDAEGNTLLARLCDDENFEKVMYLEIGGKTYIFMPTNKTLTSPSGFYETDLKLDIGEVKAFRYSNSVMDDIYIVHCWCEGKTGFYRYDSLENTIQRAPDFKMIKTSTAKPVQSGSLLGRFNALPTNGKIIIVAGILFAVLLIAFIVMIIVKLALRASLPRQLLQEDYYSDSDAANGFNLFEETEEADAADEESPIPIAEEIEEEAEEEVEEETIKETLDAAPEESQDEF